MLNVKKYMERRNAIIEDMEALLNTCNEETRAFNEEERSKFEAWQKEIKDIDEMLKMEAETRDLEKMTPAEAEKREDVETRAFAAYIRGVEVEEREAKNMTKSDNGAIIPKTIANRIIELVKEKAPIYSMSTKFNVKGDLVFPVYDESTQKITAAYAEEFSALTSTAGKFTSVTLSGYLAGALSKVSRSLINNNDFDLVSFVTAKMAEAVADFIRKELINGTTSKMTGLLSSENKVTAAAAAAVTADELIDLQMTIPQVFQSNAVWVMSKNTFKTIRKLKDGDGNYLLNKDATQSFGWELLGNRVYIDEFMEDMAAKKTPIIYGDLSGLYVKITENPSIEILREKYADEHAIGVIAWLEMDSKIVETQKIALLEMAAS